MTDGWRDSTHERTDSHVLVAILRRLLTLRICGRTCPMLGAIPASWPSSRPLVRVRFFVC
jgi:hypothetical protein